MLRLFNKLPHHLTIVLPCLAAGLMLLFAVPSVSAFYEFPDIHRLDYTWQVEIPDTQNVEVKLTQKLQNTSSKPITFEYLFPLLPQTQDVHFFVDALGQDFQILEGRDRLTRLFEKAKDTQKPLFFRLGSEPYKKLFVSQSITIKPQETLNLKLSFQTSLDFVNDIYFSEIFLYDEVASDHFELAFSLASDSPLYHFFTNLFNEALFERYQHQLVMIFERNDYLPEDNARFFWSNLKEPTLLYQTNGEVYHGHFPMREKHAPLEEVIFLLDVSGSMNGNPWTRSQEYVNFLLDRLGEDVSIKIGFVDDTLRFYKEDWIKNNYEFRKDLFAHLKTLKPLGESNLRAAFEMVAIENPWEVDADKRAFVLITDSEAFISYDPNLISAPVITLHFGSENTDLDLLSHFSGGFMQPLFKTPSKLVESEDLWEKWTNWRTNLTLDQMNLEEALSEAVPDMVRGGIADFGPFVISRTFDQYSVIYAPVAQFLPRLWGARRLAQILKSNTYTQEQKQAMLSIAHRFGIKKSFLDPEIKFKDWDNLLQNLDRNTIERLIMELETLPSGDLGKVKMVRETPFYLDSETDTWRSYDFYEQASPYTMIHIAPFSEAQQYLFEHFPSMVALGFGVAAEVDFCTPVRCFMVNDAGRRESALSDRLFFRDYDPTHWANPYLAVLINKGLLQGEENGKLHADRPIDRGAFAQMLVGLREDLGTQGFENLGMADEPFFTDVSPQSPYFSAVQYLAAKKVTQGYTKDSTFRPLQGLTRAEGLKMLLAMDGFIPPSCEEEKIVPPDKGEESRSDSGGLSSCNTEIPFTDVSGWTLPWIKEAYHRGWVKGFADGTFRPHDSLTKAEAAKLLLSQ
ncbi:MAG TPA: S-layer homology domain-containing protein [Candidatus Gracilibacteria bacterium]